MNCRIRPYGSFNFYAKKKLPMWQLLWKSNPVKDYLTETFLPELDFVK
jgi:hypothetical protein